VCVCVCVFGAFDRDPFSVTVPSKLAFVHEMNRRGVQAERVTQPICVRDLSPQYCIHDILAK
jgi:hypothetical protein